MSSSEFVDLLYQASRVLIAGTAAHLASAVYWMILMTYSKSFSGIQQPRSSLPYWIAFVSYIALALLFALCVYYSPVVNHINVLQGLWFAVRLSGLIALLQLNIRAYDLETEQQRIVFVLDMLCQTLVISVIATVLVVMK